MIGRGAPRVLLLIREKSTHLLIATAQLEVVEIQLWYHLFYVSLIIHKALVEVKDRGLGHILLICPRVQELMDALLPDILGDPRG